jgi:holo-[acyl-carrier protein] synthase
MIIGLGSDMVDIRRIERVIARHGDRFLDRIFTPAERAKAEKRDARIRAATYAKRFAAKEAASKALGTGFRAGVFWRDLGVVNLSSGAPTLRMTGGAAERLKAITPPGQLAHVALTMTDEYPYAQAMVIISAVPLTAALGGALGGARGAPAGAPVGGARAGVP